MISKDPGRIYRQDGKVIVEVRDEEWSLDQPSVVCLNPDVTKAERLYRKVFLHKRIYLPDEPGKAMAEVIDYPDNFVFSANGYSKISLEQCGIYGIKPGEYEEACTAILRNIVQHLRNEFQGAQLRLIYGASDMGVDLALEKVARRFNIALLGFSCPRFMLYVKDDDIPVYVAPDIDTYADAYIRCLDLLLTTGGREHALQHDILAACKYGKRIHFVDVLSVLSRTGGVPATVSDGNGGYRVDNAAAAFGRYISFFSSDMAIAEMPRGGDKWDAVFNNVRSVATAVCRSKMSPPRMFE
jgi:hypothetical protein